MIKHTFSVENIDGVWIYFHHSLQPNTWMGGFPEWIERERTLFPGFYDEILELIKAKYSGKSFTTTEKMFHFLGHKVREEVLKKIDELGLFKQLKDRENVCVRRIGIEKDENRKKRFEVELIDVRQMQEDLTKYIKSNDIKEKFSSFLNFSMSIFTKWRNKCVDKVMLIPLFSSIIAWRRKRAKEKECREEILKRIEKMEKKAVGININYERGEGLSQQRVKHPEFYDEEEIIKDINPYDESLTKTPESQTDFPQTTQTKFRGKDFLERDKKEKALDYTGKDYYNNRTEFVQTDEKEELVPVHDDLRMYPVGSITQKTKFYANYSGLYKDFLDKPENKALDKRIKYFVYPESQKEETFVVADGNKIIAAAGIQKSPYDKDLYWIKYISTDEQYRQQGLAKKLAEEIFKYAKEQKYGLKSSSYTGLGEKYLKPLFNQLAEKYKVRFIDAEKKFSSEEIVHANLNPLIERRDYAPEGHDILEENALELKQEGKLPEDIENQMKRRLKPFLAKNK